MRNEHDNKTECRQAMLPVLDAMYVLQGKWVLPIILALTFDKCGFRELERQVIGISPRMLSKELKHLEDNFVVSRKVLPTKPVSVEYSLTAHGKSLKSVILALQKWGSKHRSVIKERT